MKSLVLTDIHGNIDALDAVLDKDLDDSIDSIWVLGDLVGYGAGPNEVIDRLLGLSQPAVVIRGNHDRVVSTPRPDARFNSVAQEAVRWTAGALTAGHMAYLAALPSGPIEVAPGVVLCHGSPVDEDEYVIELEEAAGVFADHAGALTFYGHTHIPSCFAATKGVVKSLALQGDEVTIELDRETRYLANPGSIGQPRDRDPRAAYFVYDSATATIHWRRCPYPIETAQRRIQAAGLPEVLAHRLAVGL